MSRFNRRTVGPIVLVVAGALLAYFLVPRFGTRINIGYFLLQSVPLLLTAVGQTLVIITAGIDLSVGACVTLSGVIASLLMDPANGGSVSLALAGCVGAAVAVGLVNGLLIVSYNLPPFLATLGMTFFLAGANLYLRPVPGGHIADRPQDAASLPSSSHSGDCGGEGADRPFPCAVHIDRSRASACDCAPWDGIKSQRGLPACLRSRSR